MKKYTYFDVHSHHMFYPKNQLENYLKNAKDMDICVFFMSVDIETYVELKKLCLEYDNIVPCFGIHPQNAFKYKNNLSVLDEYIKTTAVVGEIGLDNCWCKPALRPFQHEVFLYQLNLAQKYKKPLSIHTTDAELEVYEILKNMNCKNICIHWYHGDLNLLEKFISLGCYFSIGPDIEFSQNAKKIAKLIPLNKILCETDGPDSVAWANKTKINEKHFSAYTIIEIYERLYKILNIEKSNFSQIVKQNVIDFLKV